MQNVAWLTCSCGGSTSIAVDDAQSTAVSECACGRVLLWSRDGQSAGNESAGADAEPAADNPPTLGIRTGDSVRTSERLN